MKATKLVRRKPVGKKLVRTITNVPTVTNMMYGNQVRIIQLEMPYEEIFKNLNPGQTAFASETGRMVHRMKDGRFMGYESFPLSKRDFPNG